jgi:crotonobetainyl-CoA:carnitine CoA-transferase CaiB-like acyl-CoA transferase
MQTGLTEFWNEDVSTVSRPLAGLTILEIASKGPLALDLALGLCGRIAADLGAKVIRLSARKDELSGLSKEEIAFLHSGKQRLNVASAQFDLLLHDMSASANALICDVAALNEMSLQSNLPVACIGMSIDAPMAGSEFTIEARSGLLDLVGDPQRQPLRLAGHPLAYTAGTALYLAMITCVMEHAAGESSGPKRVDLLDIGVWLNWKTLGLAKRGARIPSREGSAAEWFVVPCADGYVALVYRIQEWEALKQATGDQRLSDERFSTILLRREHSKALNAILSDIFIRMTRAEIRALSLQYKLPLGPVWTPGELIDDAHFKQTDFFHSTLFEGDSLPMPRLPVIWNGMAFPPAQEGQSA